MIILMFVMLTGCSALNEEPIAGADAETVIEQVTEVDEETIVTERGA